jgi:hypothetical protein
LALVGFTILIALPARWPLEPRDNLLDACEATICLETSSYSRSVEYVMGVGPGRVTPKSEGIIVMMRRGEREK